LYMTVKGNPGTTVDIDHMDVNAGTDLTPPVFKSGTGDTSVFAYVGMPLTADFSATDAGASDVVTYGSTNLPQGATLDTTTGAFSWQPTQTGTATFIVTASDGTTTTAKNITVTVNADRASAVQAAISVYNPGTSYVSSSLKSYQDVYNKTVAMIPTATDAGFIQQLQVLRTAAEDLQLLTPLLSDGSIDFPGIVNSSTFGNSVGLLTDGNNDTFPVYTLAPNPNLYHIIDFGPNFKVTLSQVGLQSRRPRQASGRCAAPAQAPPVSDASRFRYRVLSKPKYIPHFKSNLVLAGVPARRVMPACFPFSGNRAEKPPIYINTCFSATISAFVQKI
jgi:hypothetical protein